MKFTSILSAAAAVAATLALGLFSSCDLENSLVVSLPTQTISAAGFQLRPTTPNTVYTDSAATTPSEIYKYIQTKYDTSLYSVSNITINKITISPKDGTTQLGDLCQYMKVKLNGNDIASTLDTYDSTAVSITLQPIPGGASLETILEGLTATPLMFECKTSDEGVNETLSLSLDVDMIIELDPKE